MEIDGQTMLVGLLGWPVGHSFSPAMHNAAAARLGLNLAYVPLPARPEALAAAVSGLAALGFRGANVTVPHKQAVMPLLDELEPAAQAIGAVNTIVIDRPDDGAPHLTGYNTDWSGFADDLRRLQAPLGADAFVLGAGGSARAVAYALASAGSAVFLFARRSEQARRLVRDLTAVLPQTRLFAHSWPALADLAAAERPVLIVNTTPVGMTPGDRQSPWPAAVGLPDGSFVYDLVYNPPLTRLMQQARSSGCQAANGLGMLASQGARAFQLWTGRQPDLTVMRAAILAETL